MASFDKMKKKSNIRDSAYVPQEQQVPQQQQENNPLQIQKTVLQDEDLMELVRPALIQI
jgi:hypothetical protein